MAKLEKNDGNSKQANRSTTSWINDVHHDDVTDLKPNLLSPPASITILLTPHFGQYKLDKNFYMSKMEQVFL